MAAALCGSTWLPAIEAPTPSSGWVKQTSSPNRKVHLGDRAGRYRGTPPCPWPSRVTSPSEWTPKRSPFSRTVLELGRELARLAITRFNHRAPTVTPSGQCPISRPISTGRLVRLEQVDAGVVVGIAKVELGDEGS